MIAMGRRLELFTHLINYWAYRVLCSDILMRHAGDAHPTTGVCYFPVLMPPIADMIDAEISAHLGQRHGVLASVRAIVLDPARARF